MLGDVSASSIKDRRVHFSPDTLDTHSAKPVQRKQPSDLELVMSALERKANQLKIKELRELSFDVIAQTIRAYLEAKAENSAREINEKYFNLFEGVMHKIIPEAVENTDE